MDEEDLTPRAAAKEENAASPTVREGGVFPFAEGNLADPAYSSVMRMSCGMHCSNFTLYQ